MISTQWHVQWLAVGDQWVATELMRRETFRWICARLRADTPARIIWADHRVDQRFAAADRFMRARSSRHDREVRAIRQAFHRAGYSTEWLRG